MQHPEIHVTQQDIEQGEAGNCSRCSIALAASRAYGFAVTVGSVGLHREDAVGRRPIGTLPPEAASFIRAFDAGCPVEPFSFTPLAWQLFSPLKEPVDA